MKTNKNENQSRQDDKSNLFSKWINKIGIAAILSSVIIVGSYIGISKNTLNNFEKRITGLENQVKELNENIKPCQIMKEINEACKAANEFQKNLLNDKVYNKPNIEKNNNKLGIELE